MAVDSLEAGGHQANAAIELAQHAALRYQRRHNATRVVAPLVDDLAVRILLFAARKTFEKCRESEPFSDPDRARRNRRLIQRMVEPKFWNLRAIWMRTNLELEVERELNRAAMRGDPGLVLWRGDESEREARDLVRAALEVVSETSNDDLEAAMGHFRRGKR